MTEPRPLTPKEQKVIQEFEAVRPGTGALAENNIRNNDKTGWADIIADTPEEELVAREGSSTNSFMYRRIGG
ncbi:hypothetical protein [Halotia branconii]|uniref:Uncharacterized protein n=1 Tax=Halotia branconii CENA392 TaxID=1539056 RepID=A0AAJ6P7B4_9CYAN|nr:hypothetical protein [Halotia branconii]WGV23460.1 hypothetical protein QI031_16680 [Halotia branconii CENA392]